MRIGPVLLAFVLGAPPACRTNPAHDPSVPREAAVDPAWRELAFLVGCWRHERGDEVSEEIWAGPFGDTMYGQNRLLRRGELVFFELLTIERRADGFVYVARPNGRSPTTFELVRAGAGEAEFVNAQHDFPQRIHYRGTGDTLRATAGTLDEAASSRETQSFEWRRVHRAPPARSRQNSN